MKVHIIVPSFLATDLGRADPKVMRGKGAGGSIVGRSFISLARIKTKLTRCTIALQTVSLISCPHFSTSFAVTECSRTLVGDSRVGGGPNIQYKATSRFRRRDFRVLSANFFCVDRL